MAQHYTYEPLKDENSVRLLHVDSVSGQDVHCTLVQGRIPTEQAKGHAYLALSYCWGDEPATQKIHINGQSFFVTPNLLAGLKAIHRYKEGFNAAVNAAWVWIDAICINQNDLPEKSSQVRRMSVIFAQAQVVVVWLGEEADNSDGVMKVLLWLDCRKYLQGRKYRRLSNLISRLKSPKKRILRVEEGVMERMSFELKTEHNILEASLIALEDYLEGVEDLDSSDAVEQLLLHRESIRNAIFPQQHWWWTAFLLLINRPWFCRVWTFQEIKLASKAMVICGDHCVSWDIMQKCLYGLHIATGLYDPEIVFETLGYEATARLALSSLIFRWKIFEGVSTFRHFVKGDACRDARDPKDFIYGYLGLLDDQFKSTITINYEAPASQVFKEAVIVACKGEGGAEYWSRLMEEYMCVPKARVRELPSWCPDISCRAKDTFASFNLGESVANAVREVRFNLPLSLSNNTSQIQIPGIALDTIIRSSRVAPSNKGLSQDDRTFPFQSVTSLTLSKEWLEGIHLMFSGCEDMEALTENWLRNYFYEGTSSYYDEQKYGLEELREFCGIFQSTIPKTWNEAYDLFEDFESSFRKTRDEALDLLEGIGSSRQKAEDFVAVLLYVMFLKRGRYFFVTQAGRIGFSPKQTLPGQQICYFPGGRFLQVLSPPYDEYITSASVDGFMGTELEKLLKDENLKKFTLH